MDSWSHEPSTSGLSLEFDNEDASQILPFKNFLCSLTKEVMKDPVYCSPLKLTRGGQLTTGFSVVWRMVSTGQVLTSLEQKPNIRLAGAIEEWLNRDIDIQVKLSCQYHCEDPLFIDCAERVLDSLFKISEEHPSSR